MSLRSTPSTMAVVAALALAACSPDRVVAPSVTPAGVASASDVAYPGALIACKKTGPALDAANNQIMYHFTAEYSDGRPTLAFDLSVGQCLGIWDAVNPTDPPITIKVSEVNVPAVAQLDSIIHYYWGPTVLGADSSWMSVTLDYNSSVHYVQFFNDIEQAGPGTGTLGYWKTHPEAWPVTSIVIGGVTYTRTAAINIMLTAVKGDMSRAMFDQLVATKLNLLLGTTSSCISATVAAADAWMAGHAPGSGVAASSTAWQSISAQYVLLDRYNNGLLCAPHR